MSEKVIVRHRGEGRTVLVGGADYITYKVMSGESDGAFFCFSCPPLVASLAAGESLRISLRRPSSFQQFDTNIFVVNSAAGVLPL